MIRMRASKSGGGNDRRVRIFFQRGLLSLLPSPPLPPPGLVNGIVNSTRGFIEIFPERVDS